MTSSNFTTERASYDYEACNYRNHFANWFEKTYSTYIFRWIHAGAYSKAAITLDWYDVSAQKVYKTWHFTMKYTTQNLLHFQMHLNHFLENQLIQ